MMGTGTRFDDDSRSTSPEPRTRWRGAVRAGAVVLPPAACAALFPVREDVATSSAALLLVLGVVAAAATGDRVAGLLAALAGAAGFDFFLTSPHLSLKIDAPADVQAAVLLLVIGAAVSELALWGRRQQAVAFRRSGYLDGIADVAAAVRREDASSVALLALVAEQVRAVLDADACRFVSGPVHDARVAVLDSDGDVRRGGARWDADRLGLPTDEYLAVPVSRDAATTPGHFLVTASAEVARPHREQRRVAALLAEQVAAVVRPDPVAPSAHRDAI